MFSPSRTPFPGLRLFRYVLVRGFSLFLATMGGVYLTILVANMGGYVDQIRRAEIQEQVAERLEQDPSFAALPPELRRRRFEEAVALEEERYGLHRPFLVRSLVHLLHALRLDLGHAYVLTSDSGSRRVAAILRERLPPTLLLFGAAHLLLFVLSLMLALFLTRHYGTFWDRLWTFLAPLSAPPGWFYGLVLIVLFAAWWHWFPFGGMVRVPPPHAWPRYVMDVVHHATLPVAALVLSNLFAGVYHWRTFFLIFAREDYVEMARAKGLPPALLERRYLVRPALPPLVTHFALVMLRSWMGAPVFETVFNWPGLGRVYVEALRALDVPVMVGVTVVFAYLLAGTVFLLDVLYAWLDPRVQVE